MKEFEKTYCTKGHVVEEENLNFEGNCLCGAELVSKCKLCGVPHKPGNPICPKNVVPQSSNTTPASRAKYPQYDLDPNKVDEAIAKMDKAMSDFRDAKEDTDHEVCPVCNGNDGDRPCAYPGEQLAGCLQGPLEVDHVFEKMLYGDVGQSDELPNGKSDTPADQATQISKTITNNQRNILANQEALRESLIERCKANTRRLYQTVGPNHEVINRLYHEKQDLLQTLMNIRDIADEKDGAVWAKKYALLALEKY